MSALTVNQTILIGSELADTAVELIETQTGRTLSNEEWDQVTGELAAGFASVLARTSEQLRA